MTENGPPPFHPHNQGCHGGAAQERGVPLYWEQRPRHAAHFGRKVLAARSSQAFASLCTRACMRKRECGSLTYVRARVWESVNAGALPIGHSLC